MMMVSFKKERKQMKKIPSEKTIRKNVHHYAEKVGFIVSHAYDSRGCSFYAIHDKAMGYDTYVHATMDFVVQRIADELHMQNRLTPA